MTVYQVPGDLPEPHVKVNLLRVADASPPSKRAAVAAGESARQQDVLRLQQQQQRDAANRAAASALLARDHELARMRARHIDGVTAAGKLAEQLLFAHQQAGKPPLAELGDQVGYSKGTLSKVFNNKMPPTWALVRKLGVFLRIPPQHVMQELLPLWIAADTYRRSLKSATGRATVPLPTLTTGATAPAQPDTSSDIPTGTSAPTAAGYSCTECGSWVVDAVLHTQWHMDREPGGRSAPEAESIGAARADVTELNLLRQALRPDPQ